MKLWLDDIRPAPEGWVWAVSVDKAIYFITSSNLFEEASLDHDLGDYANEGGNGVQLTDWMAEKNIWPENKIRVHSANPVGVKTMLATIDTYGPYSQGYGTIRSR